MPVITVPKNLIKEYIYYNKEFTIKEFSSLLFDFSLELDETTPEGDFKIEIHANRPDLLSPHILVHYLRVFIGLPPFLNLNILKLLKPSPFKIQISNSVLKSARPFIKGAILYNCSFFSHPNNSQNFSDNEILRNKKQTLKTILDFQDKLSLSLGKNREILAIGNHKLSAFNFPLIYDIEKNQKTPFKALFEEEEMTVEKLFRKYKENGSIYSKYVSYFSKDIYNKNEKNGFFVLRDKESKILAIPPVINSFRTKIDENTKNIFIDITGKDLRKVENALKIVCGSFANFCERIEIVDFEFSSLSSNNNNINNNEKRKKEIENLLENFEEEKERKKEWAINSEYIEKKLGIDLSTSIQTFPSSSINENKTKSKKLSNLIKIFQRMNYETKILDSFSETLLVKPNILRTDILHLYDILEDISVGFGLNNFPAKLPKVSCFGEQSRKGKLKEMLRSFCASEGFIETNSFVLGPSKDFNDLSKLFCLSLNNNKEKEREREIVKISNPNTSTFDSVRNVLLLSVFRTALNNIKALGIPIKAFEIADCVELKNNNNIKNSKSLNLSKEKEIEQKMKLCLILLGKKGNGFEVMHGFLDSLFKIIKKEFSLVRNESRIFFKNRGADIVEVEGKRKIGFMGILSKEFLERFGVNRFEFFASVLEIDCGFFL